MNDNSLAAKYANNPTLRALVQLIPNFGGAIDTLLYEKGSKWRQERIDMMLTIFGDSINRLLNSNRSLEVQIKAKMDSEHFYDAFVRSAQTTMLTREKEKIRAFANILVNYLTFTDDDNQDYEIELFLNITSELSEKELIQLAALNEQEINHYLDYNNKWADLEAYQAAFGSTNRTITFSQQPTPDEYLITESTRLMLARLEKQFLVTISQRDESGSLPVSRSNRVESVTMPIGFQKKTSYSITEFGRKYCKWIASHV
jgi:hypothetical protein